MANGRDEQKQFYRTAGVAGLVVLAAVTLAVLIVLIDAQPSSKSAALEAASLVPQITTANTTRVQGEGNAFSDSVAISQMIYPATRDQNKPGAVMLVNVDDFATAVAATHMAHFPVNAPILYTNRDSLPEETAEEIERLDPEGVFMDGNTQVYLLGDIGEAVEDELEATGLNTRRIAGDDPSDPIENARAFDEWDAALLADHSDAVIVTNIDSPEFGVAGAAWNAHAGDGFLYVTDEGVPEPTRDALLDRAGEAFIFVFGGTDVVSDAVAVQLGEFGMVDRIPGETPQEVSVNFAGFRDAGTNWGWWLRNVKRDFGWGIAESGHGYTLVNPSYWQPMVTATIFSHMGKHAPMLLLNDDGSIPSTVRDYLELVQPGLAAPDGMSFNHGWVIADTESIPEDVQYELETLLRPKR